MVTIELVRKNVLSTLSEHELAKYGKHRIKVASDEVDSTVDRRSRMVYGWATRGVKDAELEVIDPDGVDMESYFPKKVKAMYFNHDTSMPIGVCRRAFRRNDGIFMETCITRTPLGDDMLTMVEDGCVGHYSVGGIVTRYDEPNAEDLMQHGEDTIGMVRSMILRETSLVSMPALPEAELVNSGMGDESIERVLGRIDNLLTKGKIQRTTALLAGLPITAKTNVFATGLAFGNPDTLHFKR